MRKATNTFPAVLKVCDLRCSELDVLSVVHLDQSEQSEEKGFGERCDQEPLAEFQRSCVQMENILHCKTVQYCFRHRLPNSCEISSRETPL